MDPLGRETDPPPKKEAIIEVPERDFAATPSQANTTIAPSIAASVAEKSKIFVVHGRDMRPVEVLTNCLLLLGLHMMPWSEAVNLDPDRKLRGQARQNVTLEAGMAYSMAPNRTIF